MKQIKMKLFLMALAVVFLMNPFNSLFAQEATSNKVLITNVNIFDGTSQNLIMGKDVLVQGNKIVEIGEGIMVTQDTNTTIIDGSGKTLMPGLIDAHWHTMFNFAPVSTILGIDNGLLNILAADASEKTLMRGFTTVRDVGGNSFAVKHSIDMGITNGPRIYPSGAYISQTAGHGDFRGPNDVPATFGGELDYQQRVGNTLIANGVPEVIQRTREVLRMGASQVKAMGGGGVSSLYDPLDVTEYTFEEAKAIVDIAKSWNTYVAVHINTKDAMKMWIEAGAKSMEHGFFIDDEVAKLMAENGVWWSMEPMQAEGPIAFHFESPISTAKYANLVKGLDQAIASAKKYKVKTAFGTDVLFDAELGKKQGLFLVAMQKWYTPYETLKMATADNAELLKLSGPRNPYPGDLGVVKEGAYADLLLVDGNPLKDLELVADPDKNFVIIMKDGKIYKNALDN